MSNPEISVLLPVYNDEDHVADTLASIQSQTFENHEIVAINDGSTDRSGEILDEFAKLDSRVTVTHQDNAGLGTTLNRAIELAKAPLLARHDADDLSHESRFQLQIEYLRRNENTSMLGTGIRVMGADGDIKYSPPTLTGNSQLRKRLRSSSPFAHGSVMMRRDLVRKAGGYPSIIWLEDLILWRALAQLGEIENLDQPLYDYRVAPGNLYVPRPLQKKVVALFNETWPEDNFSTQQLALLESIRNKITPKVRKTQFHLNMAKGLLLNTENKWEARKSLVHAIRTDPLLVDSWFQLVSSFLSQRFMRFWRDRRNR